MVSWLSFAVLVFFIYRWLLGGESGILNQTIERINSWIETYREISK